MEKPVEECDLEPKKVCTLATKMVPKLKPIQECVDVPKEICTMSKVNLKIVKKPTIKKWCYDSLSKAPVHYCNSIIDQNVGNLKNYNYPDSAVPGQCVFEIRKKTNVCQFR